MAQSCGLGRAILPKSGPSDQLDPVSITSSATTTPRKLASRGTKSATKTDQEWESQKANFHQLYIIENRTLEVVMEKMEELHHFKASRKQYTAKIKEWDMDIKNIKTHDMQAIIRKDRKRKAEDPLKECEFRVNGQIVDRKKIERFMERSKDRLVDIIADTEATPPHITCYTPYDPRNQPSSTALIRTRSSSDQFVDPMQPPTEYSNSYPDDHDFQLQVTEQWILRDPRSPSYGRISSPYFDSMRWSSCKPPESPHSNFPNPKYCTFPSTPSPGHCGIMVSPYYSPPSRRQSTSQADSPPWFVPDIAQPDLSPFEWFGSYINHFSVPFTPDPTAHPAVNAMLEFVAQALDTYEDRRQYEEARSYQDVKVDSFCFGVNSKNDTSLTALAYKIQDSSKSCNNLDNFPFQLHYVVEAIKSLVSTPEGLRMLRLFEPRITGPKLFEVDYWNTMVLVRQKNGVMDRESVELVKENYPYFEGHAIRRTTPRKSALRFLEFRTKNRVFLSFYQLKS